MLKQETNLPASDAAQERASAEELTRALRAIESRRQTQAEHLRGTLPIGDAVRELGLDASPEEVWAEVQQQREQARRAQAPPPAAPAAPPPLPRALGTALRDAALAAAPGLRQAAQAAAPSLKQGVDAVSRHLASPKAMKRRVRPKRRTTFREGMTAFAVVCAALGVAAGTGAFGHLHTFSSSAPVRMLSTVPDGHPVVADTATVEQIQKGNMAVTVRDTEDMTNQWTLIRHDKHWYVRGYVLDSAEVGAGPLKVYTDNNAGVLRGVEEKDVTLRLDTLHIDSDNAGDNWQEMDVSAVRPDAYTREDW